MEPTGGQVQHWLDWLGDNPQGAFLVGLLVREIIRVMDIIIAWLNIRILGDRRKDAQPRDPSNN